VKGFLQEANADEARIFIEVLTGPGWIEVLERSINTLRSPVVDTVQLQEIIASLVPVCMEMSEKHSQNMRMSNKFGEFQRTFRELAIRLDLMNDRFAARGRIETEELSTLTSDVFICVTGFFRTLKDVGQV
jgi:soluble cytochrome b562